MVIQNLPFRAIPPNEKVGGFFMSDLQELIAAAKTANVIPVIETMSADLLTPLAVYLKLSSGKNRSFLLESVEGGEALARYSFVGAGPHSIVRGNDKQVTVEDDGGTKTIEGPVLTYLRNHFSLYSLANIEGLPSFAGGAIGSLGFGCSSWFEPALKSTVTSDRNDVELMFFRTIVAFDHAKQQIKIVNLVFVDDAKGDMGMLEHAIEDAKLSNQKIKHTLEMSPLAIPSAAPSGT
jgi:anthranilate synthase component 1